MPCFQLTKAGTKKCRLGKEFTANEEYLQAFANWIKKNNVNVAMVDLQPNRDKPSDFQVLNPVEV